MEKIKGFIDKEKHYVVSINFRTNQLPADMIYISNMKRFNMIKKTCASEDMDIVVTSNILLEGTHNISVVNYSSYLNENEYIYDNAGIMCINMFSKIGIKEFLLMGFDGYSNDLKKNYYEERLFLNVDEDRIYNINMAMKEKFEQLQKHLDIEFFT